MAEGARDFAYTLHDNHEEWLKGCSLTDDVIHGRPYISLTDETRMFLVRRWKMRYAAVEPEGFIIPRYRPNGEETYPQVRYMPEIEGEDGKPQKYSCPKGSGGVIDVHPLARGLVQDAARPCAAVESVKGADALVVRGVAAVGFHGVGGWKQRADVEGLQVDKLSFPSRDWSLVPLEGRPMLVCFDVDVQHRADLQEVLKEFLGFLRSQGAVPGVAVLPEHIGEKGGLDDYMAQYSSPEERVGGAA
jgi:hypothetical protein